METIKTLKLRAHQHLDTDLILSLRGTKATGVYFCKADKQMYNEINKFDQRLADIIKDLTNSPKELTGINVTTWSSAVRNILDLLRPIINNQMLKLGTSMLFLDDYELNLRTILEEQNIGTNSNFVKRLYKESEEDDLIRSSVYMNNKNHLLQIIKDEEGIDWYACAVYTGEIIYVVQALLDTISDLYCDIYGWDKQDEIYQPYIEIDYIERQQEANEINVEEETTQTTTIVEDADGLQRDLITLTLNMKQTIYSMYQTCLKHNLSVAERYLKDVFENDVPNMLK